VKELSLSNFNSYVWTIYSIYSWMIIAYVLLSWVPNIRNSAVGEWLGKLVEPYLKPFRRLIPPIGGIIDISPIIAYFALRYVALGIEAIASWIANLVQ